MKKNLIVTLEIKVQVVSTCRIAQEKQVFKHKPKKKKRSILNKMSEIF